MFTGIVEATAKILKKSGSRLVLERPLIFDDLKIGCSIAVSGACLSVISFDDTSMSFDVVPTTFQKTKFGTLKLSDRVNLERAMRADGRFEGHVVTGHIEGVGRVAGSGSILTLELPKTLLSFVVPHGSITIDGVSLTVADVKGSKVSVALIPHTLTVTTLGELQEGDDVNIETDILGKYVLSSRHGT